MKSRKRKPIKQFSSGDMVTITEILKDDPALLQELEEFRKWSKENPEYVNFPQEKTSQGQLKMKQLLEDFRRDTNLTERISKIASAPALYKHEDLEKLYSVYLEYHIFLEVFRKEFLAKDKNYKAKKKICKKYGIDPRLFEHMLHAYRNERFEGWDFSEDQLDMCEIQYTDKLEKPVDMHDFHVSILNEIEKDVYPIKVKIHRFASKRDILDYIDTHWDEIKNDLTEKRIKQRKTPRQVSDFIWKHRDKDLKEIEAILKERYPEEGLVYYEINKILYEEKKRRKIK